MSRLLPVLPVAPASGSAPAVPPPQPPPVPALLPPPAPPPVPPLQPPPAPPLLPPPQPRLGNPDKVLWPEPAPGLTKTDFRDYLDAVAPVLLPQLRDRPLVLTRYPHGAEGSSFYQKNTPEHAPAWLSTFPYRHADRVVRYLVCQHRQALLWLADQAAIEFHPWLARTDRPERPDAMVVDLDPMAPADFEDARAVASVVRDLLGRTGLRSYPKTSGATGIHVFVPTVPRYTHRQTAEAARRIGLALLRLWPRRVTLERAVSRRAGRVYVDYLQNSAGHTLVSPYCPRPLPGAPVSTPFRWDELETVRPGDFTLRTVPGRIRAAGDLFAGRLDPGGQDLEPLLKLL